MLDSRTNAAKRNQAGADEGSAVPAAQAETLFSVSEQDNRDSGLRGNGGTMSEELHANRKHKDTVFRMLYSDKRAILELYNALNGTDYQNPDDLTVTTLENAVYMAMKNDVSFLLDERMTLYEHQSTWNPNMPLRDLIYIARLMEKEEEPELELKVRYLNINQGCNRELMERCRTLREYSEFVSRIRKYAVGETAIGEAVDRAVTECIKEGILADFLRGQRAEVVRTISSIAYCSHCNL